jgi:hypothetical protein
VYDFPLDRVPVMTPEELLMVADETSLAFTSFR